jgi:hypothetical protein
VWCGGSQKTKRRQFKARIDAGSKVRESESEAVCHTALRPQSAFTCFRLFNSAQNSASTSPRTHLSSLELASHYMGMSALSHGEESTVAGCLGRGV